MKKKYVSPLVIISKAYNMEWMLNTSQGISGGGEGTVGEHGDAKQRFYQPYNDTESLDFDK